MGRSTGADPAREALAEASARASILFGMGLLTLGDPARARALTERSLRALLAGHRESDRQPGAFLREVMIALLLKEPAANAVSNLAQREAPEHAPADPQSLWTVLASATLPARLALALAHLDDLSIDESVLMVDRLSPRGTRSRPGVSIAELSREVERADQLLRERASPRSLAELMRHAVVTSGGPGVDATIVAAKARRGRRRRRLLAAVVVLAVGGGGSLLATRDVSQTLNPTPSPSSGSPRAGERVTIDSAVIATGVSPDEEATLPALPRAWEDVALPERLSLPTGAIPALSPGLIADRSIRAVFVRRLPDGTGRAVLYLPAGSPEFVEVADVVIPPRSTLRPAVNPATIDGRRHSLALAEEGGVAIVDTTADLTTHVPYALAPDQQVGWALGSQWVIAAGETRPARISPLTGEVQPMAPPGGMGRYDIVASGQLSRVGYDFTGTVTGQQLVPGPVKTTRGPTVTSLSGWSGVGITFSSPLIPGGASAGMYAVATDLSPSASALTLPGRRPGEPALEDCRALAWAPSDRLLYVSPGTDAWRILAWDVPTGAQYQVSRLPLPDSQGPWQGEFTL